MIFLKDREAVIPIEIDWAADLATGDSIASSVWTVTPTATGGLVVNSDTETAGRAVAVVSGGAQGQAYTLRNKITTALGYVDARELTITIGTPGVEG